MYVYYEDLLPHGKKVELSDFFGILERSWGFTWKDILDKSHGKLAVVFLLSFCGVSSHRIFFLVILFSSLVSDIFLGVF